MMSANSMGTKEHPLFILSPVWIKQWPIPIFVGGWSSGEIPEADPTTTKTAGRIANISYREGKVDE